MDRLRCPILIQIADRDSVAPAAAARAAAWRAKGRVEVRVDAANLSAAREVRMLEGEPVPVTVGPDGRLELGGATENSTDVRAGNGLIHVIDAVLLPPGALPTPTPVASAPSTLVADPTPMGSGTTIARPDLGTPAASPATTDGTPTP
jgi:hypothetical protein